ncbi:exodeoxyribonuclease I [Buchnera aphidicola]|uniref:exodeoxyribonuclease I n=1 Tax=Buchnera aphidicola TaxID=9 RepID=UPI0009E60B1B|nr:exodeoxyribonuclease I [Buchnera aphidicola]
MLEKKYITDIAINKNFIFYDYETFGTNLSLDKVAQFCSIEIDNTFSRIQKKTVLFCSPPLDYLPDPQAVLITKILPQYAQSYGLNEYSFAKKISSIFLKKNTCIVGYNNIHFDDLFTRNLFYRNLLDPYSWSWKNNNFSWDILNVLRAFYIFFPNSMIWFRNSNGTISFKLSDVTIVNKIAHTKIHDASSDVMATISVVRHLYRANKCFFLFLYSLSHKKNIFLFVSSNYKKPIFYISSYFGSKNHNLGCILILGFHPFYKNCLVTINLSRNFKKLFDLYDLSLKKKLNIKKILARGIHIIYLNKAPLLFSYNSISLNNCKRLGLNYTRCQKNFFLLQKNIQIKRWILSYFVNNDFTNNNNDVDLMLYQNFFTDKDKQLFALIHKTSPSLWVSWNPIFFDNRIKELFFRLKARNFIDLLSTTDKQKWQLYCKNKFNLKAIQLYTNDLLTLKLKFQDHTEYSYLLERLMDYVNYILYKIKFLI